MIRRLDGLLQGDYRTLFRGFGLELADLREYQFADDVRHIDWNVTARLTVPYVRQYVEDREVTRLVPAGHEPLGGLRHRSDSQARPAGRLHGRAGPAAHPPRQPGGRPVLRRRGSSAPARPRGPVPGAAADQRPAAPARAWHAPPRPISTAAGGRRPGHPPPLAGLRRLGLHQRAGWEGRLRAMSRRHEVLAFRLLDPREVELPDIGPVCPRGRGDGRAAVRRHPRPALAPAVRRGGRGAGGAAGGRLPRRRGGPTVALHGGGPARELLRFAGLRRGRRRSP